MTAMQKYNSDCLNGRGDHKLVPSNDPPVMFTCERCLENFFLMGAGEIREAQDRLEKAGVPLMPLKVIYYDINAQEDLDEEEDCE
jgi:hypothetical protein